MEEKRFFLAIGLSLLIIIGWSFWVSRFYPIEQQRITTFKPTLSSSELSAVSLPEAEEKILWNNNFLFIEPSQACIKKIVFKDYPNEEMILEKGLFLDIGGSFWQQKDKEKNGLYFTYEDDKKKIIKEFIFSKLNNIIELKIKIQNLLSQIQKLDFILMAKELTSAQLSSPEARFYELIFYQKEKDIRCNLRRNLAIDNIEFLGFRNRYFCLILEPQLKDFQGFIHKNSDSRVQIGLNSQIELLPSESKELNFVIYLGPQKLSQISSIKKEWSSIVHYGAFDAITRILLWLLNLFYNLFHNWGLAIITLSIFIYILLYPLTLKQLVSMKKLQALQPQIEEIKKLYQNNPQRLNKEILELYRKEKINPLGGCLPLVLQIPIFFALYQGLMRAIDLKGSSFLWIKDLAEPDRFTVLGKQFNLLPILLIIIMFLQQRTSRFMGTGQSEQQKVFSIIFPLILGIIFYSLPSALVLYWVINSILMYIFQFKIR